LTTALDKQSRNQNSDGENTSKVCHVISFE
jgi:hypothetical protein